MKATNQPLAIQIVRDALALGTFTQRDIWQVTGISEPYISQQLGGTRPVTQELVNICVRLAREGRVGGQAEGNAYVYRERQIGGPIDMLPDNTYLAEPSLSHHLYPVNREIATVQAELAKDAKVQVAAGDRLVAIARGEKPDPDLDRHIEVLAAAVEPGFDYDVATERLSRLEMFRNWLLSGCKDRDENLPEFEKLLPDLF